jgi:cytoskeletal protein CcmA (bactofilin family)
MLLNRKPRSLAAHERVHSDAPDWLGVRKPNRMPAPSRIDASTTVTGQLSSEGDIELDGHVCGSIRCAQLIVGRDAAVTGAITAEEVAVRGRVTGTIRANLVILQSTARIEADIVYCLLAMDEGATFEGLARRRLNPLQDEDGSPALADLQRVLEGPHAGNTPCAADTDGRPRPKEQSPSATGLTASG